MEHAAIAQASPPRTEVLTRETLNVLIAEPSPQLAERMQELVKVNDQVRIVATVETEDDGLAACDRHSIGLAVIELQLAQGTGFGLIRRLRHSNEPRCIVVMTNHAVPALKIASFEAGADFFLDKSKDFATLPRLVQELLTEQ